MPDSNSNITTGSPVGDMETRLEEGEQSKIILLLKRGVKKNRVWELFGGGSKGKTPWCMEKNGVQTRWKRSPVIE